MSELPIGSGDGPEVQIERGLLEQTKDKLKKSKLSKVIAAVSLLVATMSLEMPNAEACTGTHCDAQGTVELAGGSWLNGQGVDIYANQGDASFDSGVYDYVITPSGQRVKTGEEWQCVELVNRLYLTRGWITDTWSGNGNQLFGNAPANLNKEMEGQISYLNPGDVVALDDGSYGHVGVGSSYNSSTGAVDLVNQNTGVVHSSANMYNGTLTMNGWSGYGVQGVIHRPQSSNVSQMSYARAETTKAADLNGDGFDDLYAEGERSDTAQNEQVFPGSNWLGSSQLWATPPGNMIWYSDSINLAADIDGDNKDDLVTISNNSSGGNPNIFWQRSNGNSFDTPQHVGTPSLISRNTRWATGDVTGDGYDDIIAFSKRDDVGTNIFVFRSLKNWVGGMESWGATGSDVPFLASNFLPGDKNGDGKTDLYAVAKHDGRSEPFIYWLPSNGQNFESPRLTAVPGIIYDDAKFTAGDFNGDGKTDIMANTKRSDPAPNLSVYISDGGDSYSSMSLWSAPAELHWADAKFVPADLDKDGDKDLLAIQNYNGINPGIYWLKAHNGHFESPVLVGVPNGRYDQMKWGS